MPVTIHDVARRLDLSVTTVSRALAGYNDVAEATRMRVVETAGEMGYAPTHAARQLRRKRTEAIGLVFPLAGSRFSDPFFSEFMAGVGDEASRHNYDLLVSVAAPGEAEEQTYQRLVNSQRVDGFILFRTRLEDWRFQYLEANNVPFVSFGRSKANSKSFQIGVDGENGMQQLVQHMVDQGHRRIAFIGAPPNLTLAQDRFEGYKRGLAEAGIELDESLILPGELTQSSGYESARRLLALEPPPNAIIGTNDLTALGAVRAVQELGFNVGVEVAVAGFDGIEAGEHSHPSLTTVYQPVYDIGRESCSVLLSMIEGEMPPEQLRVVEPELMIRQSTAPAEHVGSG